MYFQPQWNPQYYAMRAVGHGDPRYANPLCGGRKCPPYTICCNATQECVDSSLQCPTITAPTQTRQRRRRRRRRLVYSNPTKISYRVGKWLGPTRPVKIASTKTKVRAKAIPTLPQSLSDRGLVGNPAISICSCPKGQIAYWSKAGKCACHTPRRSRGRRRIRFS